MRSSLLPGELGGSAVRPHWTGGQRRMGGLPAAFHMAIEGLMRAVLIKPATFSIAPAPIGRSTKNV